MEITRWLAQARRDLETAAYLFDGRRFKEASIFCQQAAEKAIKGFLVFYDQRFEKTHDLQVLITLATSADPSVSALLDNG